MYYAYGVSGPSLLNKNILVCVILLGIEIHFVNILDWSERYSSVHKLWR